MPQLITLEADGPLGKAGTQVWVDDAAQAQTPEGWTDPDSPEAEKPEADPAPAEKPAKGKAAQADSSSEPPAT